MKRKKYNRPQKHAPKSDAGPTLDDLKRMRADGPPPQERTEGLLLSEIHTAPKVFQFRTPPLAEERDLMGDLANTIENPGQRPIEPIVVYAVGRRFYVIDGHHRYDAYCAAKWTAPIPVEYFRGTLKEAVGEAAARNSSNKLPFSENERTGAAWRLMRDGARDPEMHFTWAEIKEQSKAAHQSLSRMSKVLKILGERAYHMEWGEARNAANALKRDATTAVGDDEWKMGKARKLAEHMTKGPLLRKNPEVTAMALAMVSPKLPEELVEEWLPMAARQLVAVAETNNPDNPEKAQALEEALSEALGFDLREPDDAGDAEDDGWNSL